ncbi:MAG TPA: DUF29 family protein [Thermodesulfovibrionia bacterium]|nr:DUF29 family protein [Thermodesulfovibrionia bacterium]
MEELFELRSHIEHGRYSEALTLIGEMEEMSKDDKINKIESYIEILLLHVIKQHAEKRSTRSWDVSISNAATKIRNTNKRRKSGGCYLTKEDIKEAIAEAWPVALRRASLEAFEGRYDESEIAQRIDKGAILQEALQLIDQSV